MAYNPIALHYLNITAHRNGPQNSAPTQPSTHGQGQLALLPTHHGIHFSVVDGSRYALIEAHEGWSFNQSASGERAAERVLAIMSQAPRDHTWQDSGETVSSETDWDGPEWGGWGIVGSLPADQSIGESIAVAGPQSTGRGEEDIDLDITNDLDIDLDVDPAVHLAEES